VIESVRRTAWSGRATDVDVVLDLMIHDIDLALVLAGAPVIEVAATGASIFTPTNDTAEARLTFANGVVATLAASRIAVAGQRTLTVTERDGQSFADFTTSSLSQVSLRAGLPVSETIAIGRTDALAAEIDGFLGCVASRRPPAVDGAAGLNAVRVAQMITSAIAETRPSEPPFLQRTLHS
jgi:predicted dehydrogenase